MNKNKKQNRTLVPDKPLLQDGVFRPPHWVLTLSLTVFLHHWGPPALKKTLCLSYVLHVYVHHHPSPTKFMGFPGGGSSKELTCQCRFNCWVRKISWRRAWQPTPVFFPGESHGQRSLVGYSPGSQKVRHNWSNLACTCMPQIHILKP